MDNVVCYCLGVFMGTIFGLAIKKLAEEQEEKNQTIHFAGAVEDFLDLLLGDALGRETPISSSRDRAAVASSLLG